MLHDCSPQAAIVPRIVSISQDVFSLIKQPDPVATHFLARSP
jgi:hypothetical protein